MRIAPIARDVSRSWQCAASASTNVAMDFGIYQRAYWSACHLRKLNERRVMRNAPTVHHVLSLGNMQQMYSATRALVRAPHALGKHPGMELSN